MKSFRQYIKEDVDLMPASTTDDLQPDNVGQIANINIMLKRVSNDIYKNPYEALQRLRQQLAYYSIHLPKFIFTNPTSGETAFEVQQFGGPIGMDTTGRVKTEADPASMFIYFSWNVNDEGMYEIDAELMDEDNLEGILGGQEEDADDANALAYRQADNIMGEETLDEEQIDEISKKKRDEYGEKAGKSWQKAQDDYHGNQTGGYLKKKAGQTLNKRERGFASLKKRLQKEEDLDEGLFDRFKSKEKKPTRGIKSNSSGATGGKWRANFEWGELDNNENKSILKKGRANLIAHYGYGFTLKDGNKSLGDGHWRYSKGFTFEDGPLKGKTFPTPEKVLAAVSNIREELIDENAARLAWAVANTDAGKAVGKRFIQSKARGIKGLAQKSLPLGPKINELSPTTYKSYKDRASGEKRTLDWVGDDEDEATRRKKANRTRGIKQAKSKTNINELSPDKLQRYAAAAHNDKYHNQQLKKYSTKKEFRDEADSVINKRDRGLKQARKKLGLNKEQ